MSDEPHIELDDYVLGEASPEQAAAVERRAATDPAFAHELAGLQEVAALLSGLPAETWPESSRVIPPAPRDRGREPARRSGRRRALGRLAMAGAGVLLLAAGIAIGVLIEQGGSAGRARTIALRALPASPRADAASARTNGGRITLTVSHLPALGADHYYELWLMNSTSSLVALASFRVSASGHARLELPLPVDASRFRYLDISLQSLGGGPAHSGDSVVRGRLAS